VKKGFPLSTYLELIAAAIQSVVIMILIGFYQGKTKEVLGALVAILSGFTIFVKSSYVPTAALGMVQLFASLFSNYANVPQILLSFQTKHAAWSGVTAFLSMAGCFIRILTTLQLTKDRLIVGGYILGLITNGILFAQVLLYGKR
jgi:hypothetical protein